VGVVERFSVLRWGIATMNVNMEVCGNPFRDTHNRIRAVARAEVVSVCSVCVYFMSTYFVEGKHVQISSHVIACNFFN